MAKPEPEPSTLAARLAQLAQEDEPNEKGNIVSIPGHQNEEDLGSETKLGKQDTHKSLKNGEKPSSDIFS